MTPKLPTLSDYELHDDALVQIDRLSRRAIRSAIVAYESLRGEEATVSELKTMLAQQKQIMAVLNGHVLGWMLAAKAMNGRGDNNALRKALTTKINDLTELLRQLDENDEQKARAGEVA